MPGPMTSIELMVTGDHHDGLVLEGFSCPSKTAETVIDVTGQDDNIRLRINPFAVLNRGQMMV
jgi:hypothetical protein